MCCKKHSIEIETFDVWMVRTGKSKCGAGQPEASSTFGWGVPDPSFQWDLKDNCLCKSPFLCLCWAWVLPSPVPKHSPALLVQPPWQSDCMVALVLQPSLQCHFPADPQVEQTQQIQKGWICSPLWIQALAGVGGHPFPGILWPEVII